MRGQLFLCWTPPAGNPLNARKRKDVDITELTLVRSAGIFTLYSAGENQEALDSLGPNDNNPNSVFTRVLVFGPRENWS